jgi:hypothetical protein
MIRKMPPSQVMRGGQRFFLATNAKRLRGDHAQTRRLSGLTIRRKNHHAPGKEKPAAVSSAGFRNSCDDDDMQVICPTCQILFLRASICARELSIQIPEPAARSSRWQPVRGLWQAVPAI